MGRLGVRGCGFVVDFSLCSTNSTMMLRDHVGNGLGGTIATFVSDAAV